MNSSPVQWSEEKQKQLEQHLVGDWAEDTWILASTNPKYGRRYLRFTLISPSLKVEFKYVVWSKLNNEKMKVESVMFAFRQYVHGLCDWLNHLTPPVQSLMEQSLDQWEASLRLYLMQQGKLKQKSRKVLSSTQEFVEYINEDRHIVLLRRFYKTIRDAYDDRSVMEKDAWDLRGMGFVSNPAGRQFLLNFTLISQTWLRSLAKEFIKHELAIRKSVGTCRGLLVSIRAFSSFLAQHCPSIQAGDIDRRTIVRFISYLKESGASGDRRNQLLSHIRIFLETCALHLGIEGLIRERIIFNDDLPGRSTTPSREIPESVLAQLREHLETLPTMILRMVVILMECGMRVNELCALPLDCLSGDEEHGWFLRSYQSKMKQELRWLFSFPVGLSPKTLAE